jgi:hypothetical protein
MPAFFLPDPSPEEMIYPEDIRGFKDKAEVSSISIARR